VILGVPVTVTSSEKLILIDITAPALYEPLAIDDVTDTMLGAERATAGRRVRNNKKQVRSFRGNMNVLAPAHARIKSFTLLKVFLYPTLGRPFYVVLLGGKMQKLAGEFQGEVVAEFGMVKRCMWFVSC
jgi:hypothetical protein